MNDSLRNSQQLFDVAGKVAVITGASGAFGALASKVLASAGARLVLATGNRKALDDKARTVREGFLARVPLGRLGEPEDLAGPLLFLCSRASDFHTGHTVYADGGYTAG
jgi:NAD(P)-dependent dehydrogenase (short-subunit alcohol dehydrogenase family)